MFLAAPPEVRPPEAVRRRWRRPSWGWCATKRALLLPAVCLVAAVIVLFASGGSLDGMPDSWFFPDDQVNLTADHLLDGLLTADFSYRSCRSRYEFAAYHKKSSHKPSPYLLAKLRKQEALQKRCGPGTAAYKKAFRRLQSSADVEDDDGECRYLVNISFRGLGNRMLAITSAFLYAVLTERVLLVHWGNKGAAAGGLFCEPFPGTTWTLPRAAATKRSPFGNLNDYDEASEKSLGNMLHSGAVVSAAGGGNVSWAASPRRPPAYVFLHLAGGYGFHDKLFFCGAHQRLLQEVPWLLMRTDSYLVLGLFLTPPFAGELGAMFPEKDAAFHHLGRYLFHPGNAAWRAVTRYYRSHLAGAGSRVGIQIRVLHEKQPPQMALDQLLSCVRDEKLLPPENTTSDDAILVASLSSWYGDRIREEYGGGGGRIAGGGVYQPSHEGEQRWGDAAHDARALAEVYLLSTCDALVTSGFSTFGYVAAGLAGLRPWVMPRPSPWEEWTEAQAQATATEPPCRRALSVEPCFQSPSYYDCEAGRDVELDRVRPYIRRCVDVRWGIQLVNGSSSSGW
ncbi:unnamed protein product [Urochloa humidicola]